MRRLCNLSALGASWCITSPSGCAERARMRQRIEMDTCQRLLLYRLVLQFAPSIRRCILQATRIVIEGFFLEKRGRGLLLLLQLNATKRQSWGVHSCVPKVRIISSVCTVVEVACHYQASQARTIHPTGLWNYWNRFLWRLERLR